MNNITIYELLKDIEIDALKCRVEQLKKENEKLKEALGWQSKTIIELTKGVGKNVQLGDRKKDSRKEI